MRNWLVAFAAALLIILGYAVGPLGVVAVAATCWIALFLLQANELGFGRAWTTFGYDRLELPPTRADWAMFMTIFADRDKVVQAATIAMAATASALVLPSEIVLIGALIALGAATYRIRARHPAPPVPAIAPPTLPIAAPVIAPPQAPSVQPAVAAPTLAPPPPAPAPARATVTPTAAPAATSTPAPAPATSALSRGRRGAMASASSLALMARGRSRMLRLRRSAKRPKRPGKSRTSRKGTRHLPLREKVPQGRRSIRPPKRALRSSPKLPFRPSRRPSS